MRTGRAVWALARADFLERVRRYSFFLTMMFALGLGYGAATGRISISMGDYRGIYTSAWIGALVAMITTCFVTLVGFYVVKGAVDRDRQTGVGQILAATPMSKPAYALGKFLSNFGVLASMVIALAVCALVMQLWRSEDSHVDSIALLSPFVLVALPAMALTAAMAVLFEMLPVLRGGAGNVIWFFVWSFGGLALPEMSGNPRLDPMGFAVLANSMMAAARAVIPGYKNSFSLTISPNHAQIATQLRWTGVEWDAGAIGLRLAWFVAAILVTLVAAIFFDRFDATRGLGIGFGGRAAKAKLPAVNSPATVGEVGRAAMERSPAGAAMPRAQLHLSALASNARSQGFGRLFEAELRLALQGQRWWWYAVAAGLLVAEIFVPLDVARGPLLAFAWLWPVLIWSAMGARETRFATRGLLFSSAGILKRQLPACFLAGVAVAALAGAGIAVRLALAGNSAGVIAWVAGAIFLPALALGLGVVSGTGKPFEALLTAMWYVGPMNHTAGMDYTGAANGGATVRYAMIYFAMSAALLAGAFLLRSKQLRED